MLRWLIIIVACLTVLFIVSIPLFTVAAWVGSKKLQVEVRVIDTHESIAVSGAEVKLFRGPSTPLEGWAIPKPDDFSADSPRSATETAVTDSDGHCTFTYSFWAAGSDGLLRHSGYVETSRVWLSVSAPDRPPALIPLDRQSIRPRDIRDTTPLYVTVVLNKWSPEQ
jgi:hypothetical protein